MSQMLKQKRRMKKSRIEVAEQSEVNISISWIRDISEQVLQGEKHPGNAPVSLVFVGDEFMTDLNLRYFNKNDSTDVISFFLDEDAFKIDTDSPWGEIYVNIDRAKEQAKIYRVTYQVEIARLVIHGLLHLLGYEDRSSVDKNRMTELENHYLTLINKNMEG